MHFQGCHFLKIIAGCIACTSDAQDSITRGKVEFDFMVSSCNFMSEFQRKQGIQDCTVLFLHQIIELGICLKISGSPLITSKHFVKCCNIIAKRGADFPKLHWSNCHDIPSLLLGACAVAPRPRMRRVRAGGHPHPRCALPLPLGEGRGERLNRAFTAPLSTAILIL